LENSGIRESSRHPSCGVDGKFRAVDGELDLHKLRTFCSLDEYLALGEPFMSASLAFAPLKERELKGI
ncbi:MAG: hypothetical protein M3255_08330, partial [Pseudomonadota bacterium]|nr:hypothetical protein [Pseudomonadota bacterium]